MGNLGHVTYGPSEWTHDTLTPPSLFVHSRVLGQILDVHVRLEVEAISLKQEIADRRAEIYSDGYPMSIGELINLYQDDELDIHPEFQRFFRWTDDQKSRLIESILLGISIPSIFVSQREDGVWDVIDGLQRLATIFQLVGILKNDKDQLEEPLKLTGTTYLPSLGRYFPYWESSGSMGSPNEMMA